MSKVILHSDCNNFYASVEMLYNEKLRNIPFVVGGDTEKRHGIVLAKNEIAKKKGVVTGEAFWQAKKKCPNLIVVRPHFDRYNKYSKLVKEIYYSYTDEVESFGLDECFLDVTGSQKLFGTGYEIADKIRNQIKNELGITVSIGVSYNKIFAKLGSDLKKPDAITTIYKDEIESKVWGLDVRKLLFVGKAAEEKLAKKGIYTIGDLANTDSELLIEWFGKQGLDMWQNANGYGSDVVRKIDEASEIKSIGNGTTAQKDLLSTEEVKPVVMMLSESVANRLRNDNLQATVVQIQIKYSNFKSEDRQTTFEFPTCTSDTIYRIAMELFEKNWTGKPVRAITIRTTGLIPYGERQMSFLPEVDRDIKNEKLENSIDDVRDKFGWDIIKRGALLKTDSIKREINPNDKDTLHGVAFDKK